MLPSEPTDVSVGGLPPLFSDLTATASEVLGRPVRHETFSDDELAAKLGVPAGAASFMLGLYIASRAGEFAPADPALEQLLGRSPVTMRELIAKRVES